MASAYLYAESPSQGRILIPSVNVNLKIADVEALFGEVTYHGYGEPASRPVALRIGHETGGFSCVVARLP